MSRERDRAAYRRASTRGGTGSILRPTSSLGGTLRHLVALVTLLLSGLQTEAAADVTIKQTVAAKVLGVGQTSASTTYIKGAKMRTETVIDDSTEVTIVDLDAQKMYAFDLENTQAEVYSLAARQAELAKAGSHGDVVATLARSGKTKTIAGRKALGYRVTVSGPASLGGDDTAGTLTMRGLVWIVQHGPGSAEWARFFTLAADKGLGLGDALGVEITEGQSGAMTELYRQIAETGGVPYEMDLVITTNGSGALASLMSAVGGGSATAKVTSVAVGPLADALFTPPAGYTLKERQ